MTLLREARVEQRIDRRLLACWAAWTLLVLGRCFVQLWRVVLYRQSELGPIAMHAAVQIAGCVALAAGATLAGLGAARGWRAARRRFGRRFEGACFIAAGVVATPWFAGRDALLA